MRYVVDGDSDHDEVVVLVHGVGSDLTAWDRIAAELANRAVVVRYDLPGHGRSAARKSTVDDLVEDHVELLRHLGVPRAHLVGFSLGGLVAQAVALAHPEVVDRLVLIGTVAGRTPTERERVLARLEGVRRDGPGAGDASRWFTDDFRRREPDAVARNLKRTAETDPESYLAAYTVLATTDFADRLPLISAPTLAMTGSDDVGSPPHMAELIAARVRDGRHLVLDGYKHGVLDEAPLVIAGETAKFLFEGEDR